MKKKILAGILAITMTFAAFSAPVCENLVNDSAVTVSAVASKKVKLARQKIRATKSGKNSVKVAYKKDKKASGYQIKICSNKKFKGGKVVKVKSAKTTAKTIQKLKSGKKYYVKVRSYKKSGKKVYFGKWSPVKTVWTKKSTRKHINIVKPTNVYKCTEQYKVNYSGYKLYSAPSINSTPIANLKEGQIVYIYGNNRTTDGTGSYYDSNGYSWSYIKVGSKFGWAQQSYNPDPTSPPEKYIVVPAHGGYGKPAIYLYPTKKTDVSVKVKLKTSELATTYPKYKNGWNVTAYPDGKIVNKADGEKYDYLFWESVNDTTKFDFSKGFVIKGKDSEKFLRKALKKLGLNSDERNEFIVYWLPKLEKNKYNFITFQTKAYTDNAILEVNPKPDSVLRVFMAYKPLEKKISVPKQQLKGFVRKGFTLVEWGGEEIGF